MDVFLKKVSKNQYWSQKFLSHTTIFGGEGAILFIWHWLGTKSYLLFYEHVHSASHKFWNCSPKTTKKKFQKILNNFFIQSNRH